MCGLTCNDWQAVMLVQLHTQLFQFCYLVDVSPTCLAQQLEQLCMLLLQYLQQNSSNAAVHENLSVQQISTPPSPLALPSTLNTGVLLFTHMHYALLASLLVWFDLTPRTAQGHTHAPVGAAAMGEA
jgi:hypothetical protein